MKSLIWRKSAYVFIGAVSYVTLFVCGALANPARAADWPTYRHDFARSGVTQDQLKSSLHRQWTYQALHPPDPAWPEPGRELNRMAFDYAYNVAVADGVAYFGSSADHRIYALDLESGKTRWSYCTGGPVRFAPTIDRGRVYAGSDDGCVYCLSADDGDLLWRFRGGPRQEMVVGNERMISRWPVRTGVGVRNGVAYFAAGMWPSEGVFVYALRAEDGSVIWKNSTSGTAYKPQPHPTSFSLTGVAPQGYILGQDQRVFVPTGRNVPAAYDIESGELLHYRSAPPTWNDRWGGTWNMLARGLLFTWRTHIGPDIDIMKGEYSPDPNDGIVVLDAGTGTRKRDGRGPLHTVVSGDTLYATGKGQVAAYDFDRWMGGSHEPEWKVKHDRTYTLIMAGNKLVTGGRGKVSVVDVDRKKVVWQDDVEGQVRNLAVADGRLLASTTKGRIICYGAGRVTSPPVHSRTPEKLDREDTTADTVERLLESTGKRTGYCLVLGADDVSFLSELAGQSNLQICCLESERGKVRSLREKLHAAGLYGVPVTVHQGTCDELCYPDYFADLVVVSGKLVQDPGQASARELYRVLHPYGGRLCVLSGESADRDKAMEWLRSGGVPQGEMTASDRMVQVARGGLPGDGQWTHQYASPARTGCSTDRRVRLPLELLWFGKPGPSRMLNRHWRGPAPLCVNGRMFIRGQYSLTAVDAYNGRRLWRRQCDTQVRWPVQDTGGCIAADQEGVYLLRKQECLRLDPATGKELRTYHIPEPDKNKGKLWSYLAVGEDRILGSIGDKRRGTKVFCLDKSGNVQWIYPAGQVVTNNCICMKGNRVYLMDRTSSGKITAAGRRGREIDVRALLVALDLATGDVVWKRQMGPKSRTDLWSAQDVIVATGGGGITGYDASTGEQLYNRPANPRRGPVIVGDTIHAEPYCYDLRTGQRRRSEKGLTAEEKPWAYQRSYGCGSISAAPNMLMFRSGTFGFYDLEGQTGIHNFGGIRAGCYVNLIAANGLVMAPPGDAACTCSYNFQTTIALAPAEKEREWSVFYERLPVGTVERAALNLGAPADREGRDARMWLAAPRPATQRHRTGPGKPFRFETHPEYGRYYHDGELADIEGTDQPWVYTTGLKGLRRAELDLEIFKRGITSWPAEQSPTVDGRHGEDCWDGYRSVPVSHEKASATLRYDKDNLYVAYERPAGEGQSWKKGTSGDDAPVWQDDSFELYLSNASRPDRCLHLGVSASGAQYDAHWEFRTISLPERDIPRVDAAVDGKARDWGDKGLRVTSLAGPRRGQYGKMRGPNNFDPSFRIGWNDDGLLVLAKVKDNRVHEWENDAQLWRGDSVEIYMTPERGIREHVQCILTPGDGPDHQPRVRFYDRRGDIAKSELSARVAGGKTDSGYMIEALLPWKNIGVKPAVGQKFAMQLLANDDDVDGQRFQVRWHPAGSPQDDPLAYQTFRLARKPGEPLEFKRSEKPDGEGYFTAVQPTPLPVKVPPMGAHGEDPEFDAEWSHRVRAGEDNFTAELAIPWTTLSEAGLNREDLIANVHSRGPLQHPPDRAPHYEPLILVPERATKPRKLTVRLHFAELEGAQPGERVFDVKLQGRTVLKDFDIAEAAGGSRRAVVREFKNIQAARALTLELIPGAEKLTRTTIPTISAIEILPASGKQ